MLGKTLAHYEIVGLLGRGGMGEVYRARDGRLDREVALKILPAAMASDPSRLERFHLEAKTVAALSHPHIVHMYSVEEADGICFLTMELVEGEELVASLKNGPLAVAKVLEIGEAVADALAEAHDKGVIHRDLKPANVMVSAEGRVKVLDFGLAKLAEPEPEDDEDATQALELTRQGTILGTAPYMSPEQLRNEPLDARSDLFSLGVLLYELTTGHRPFQGTNSADLVSAILKDEPEPLRPFGATVPAPLAGIVFACLAKRPEDRPASAAIVRDNLAALRRDLDSGQSRSRSISWTGPVEIGSIRRRRRIVSVGGLALVIFAIVWWRTHLPPPAAAESTRPIVAVLPFENLGSPDQEYFAAGITDEITSRLALIDGLGVISNTSARVYSGTDKSIPQVGKELGADFVLEGAIRWDESSVPGRVRISPRLIRVSNDTNLWLENYDREVNQVFELQSDIASHIAAALDVTLLEPVRQALQQQPTENMEAYRAYLQGCRSLNAPGFSREAFELGVQMFERATILDPRFAMAYARLSSMHSRMYHYGFDRTSDRLHAAKVAADRALALDANLAEARLALGHYYYWGTREYDLALVELEQARIIEPNNSEVWLTIAYVKRRQGAFEDAIELLERDRELSPLDPNVSVALGETYGTLRRDAESEAAYRQAISLAPEDSYAYTELAMLELRRHGDPQAARAHLAAMPSIENNEVRRVRYFTELLDRNWGEALAALDGVTGSAVEAGTFYYPVSLLQGLTLWAAGDDEGAQRLLVVAAALIDNELELNPEDHRLHSALGLADAALGRSDSAIRHAERAVELYPLKRDALGAPVQIVNLALAHALLGDADAAAAQLRKALSIPSTMSVAWLHVDPRWDRVRDSEPFMDLVAEFRGQ